MDRRFFSTLFALVISALGFLCLCSCHEDAPPDLLHHAIYVWQRQWGDETAEAIRTAAPFADEFMILAGEAQREGERTTWSMTQLDWGALAEAARGGVSVSVVFRLNAGFVPVLSGEDGKREDLLDELKDRIEEVRAAAAVRGVAIASVQLDYDCPTARVSDYARFARDLRHLAPDQRFWITALPTWLDSADFGGLAKELEGFVVQAHSIEPPKSIDEAAVLCDVKKLPRWIARAARFKKPYLVALPTYGYHVIFDDKGGLAGVMAERELSLDPSARYVERLAQANPEEMADVVAQLKNERPSNCRGVAWFRLPVASDELNWPWPALRAVMEGRVPRAAFRVDLSNPNGDPELIEIRAVNIGEGNSDGRIRFRIDWKGRGYVASDLLNGFAEEAGGALSGPAPELDNSVFVGWYRFASSNNPPSAPETGEIEALP